MQEINMKQCLMIQTNDKKKFFTHEKNLPQLIAFSKAFNAQISIVQVSNEKEILELEELAPAICEKKSQNKTEYEIVEAKVKIKGNRPIILKRAKIIKNNIKNNLIKGETVSLKELSQKYNTITTACLCNHFKQIRQELENLGYSFIKVGGGKYRIKS
jgi:hypothetical protein